MEDEIQTLDNLPSRFPLTEEEPWRSEGIHKMIVMNFIVYYYIDKDSFEVTVAAVIYTGRDQRAILDSL